MIPQIKEVNFGPNTANDYATLHQATVNLSTMGDRTITTQVRIDGDVVPDFTGWELEFRGERFILPTREPQARKDNTTKNSLIDLTFYSWPVYELKRYFFVEMSSTTSGTAIADKYDASLALNLENFVDAFNLVLDHYFNGRIQISLFGQGQGIYSTDPVFFEINYTKLWEVLQKVYEMYNVRWWFDYDSASGIYLIKMGYTADSIDDHDFSYGYKGGLLSFERTVQSDDLVNILLGRGGEKNLPYRYFKRTDPDNPGWTADPDAIPELANIYFDRLHDVNFRWYVRGWMTNPNRDRSWEQDGYVYPTYSIDSDSPYYFAYQKGATDAKFNPVEYVKDDESIAAHGEVWGALDDNDDIYPTIQGVDIPNDSPDIGRVDESVAISQIETDDISAYASAAAVETTIKDMKVSLSGNNVLTHTIYSEPFTIAQGETGNVTYRPFSKETVYPNFVYYDTTRSTLVAEPLSGGSDQSGTASYDESTGLYAVSGLPAGTYRLKLNLVLRVDRPAQLATGTFGIENVVLTTSAANTNAWKPTFDIWVKNIWQTTQGTNESNKDYAERVWGPILGDRLGDEAKIVFSTGAMSISQDYEFVIADYPVPDKTKTLNGVRSEWKITVYKSDAEYQATGLYIPNASSTQPLAGDKFFFVGIDMPFQYVEWAEERLNQYKTDNLEGLSEISPTWTLKLDKVRINSLEDEDYGQKLADRLDAGVMIRTTDPRFTHGDILSLYIQSITWTWNEPSKNNPYIVPDVEVILADKVSAVESPISRLENDVDVISQTYVQSGDVEAVVRRVAGALFLKKTGESDSSSSPTTFSSKVTSRNFRKGGIGGAGWGLYEDNSRKFSQSSPATRADVSDEEETVEPRTVLEVDRLVVREEMEVNNLVINQISARGGREIISAARIETTLVRETSTSYVCYFDQKQNSVANLFQVNDIAYGQVWSPDNMELRFYKMLVTAVDVNSITLAKAGRYGSGAPQEGDVIVQYGNTTDARRQYVIIRDVVGGGHDRMLSGLNSVSAEGVEYYYAGVETGDTPRWFVGDREAEYAEYKDGVLNIKGQLSVLKSDGSYQAMSDYIDQINANETNLQNQIDNNIQTWSASASPLPISDGGTVDPTTANYPASQWEDDETRLKHVGDIYTDETSGQSYRYTRLPNDGDFYWMRISDEEAAQALQQANQALQGLAGLNYLKAATNNGTTLVDGGLILSNLIALGKTEEDVFNIYSGINGIMDSNAYGNGIAAWYGGPMTDHEAEPTEALYANSLFRFDGSGYLAGGLLKWGLDNGAAFLTLNGQAVVGGLGGTTLNDIANLLFDVVQYKTGHYAVKLRPNAYYGGNLVAIDGLYAEGWVSAAGVSDQGGGGVGTGYLRDLLDVNASMSPIQGQALVWDDALGKWTAGDVSVDLTPFERIANRVTTVSSSSNHTQYPTAKAVYDIVNTMLSSAMRFQGVTSTALVDGSTTNPVVVDGASYTATRGDVVVRSDVGLEYLWTGAKWQQLGDETSYAKKTVTITGSGYLTGGGNLEAARTIDIADAVKTKIDNGATAFSYFTDGAANEAIKLRTQRSIWGQPFDGHADVSGAMTGVTTVNSFINAERGDSNAAYLFLTNVYAPVDYAHIFVSNQDKSTTHRPLVLQNGYGNVGVGIPSPAYKLDVSGDSRTSGKVYIGTSGGYLEVVNVGTTASPVYALKSSLPFYSDSWVSAGGVSSTGSGGGITGYLKDLLDVNGSMIPVDGQALVWDSSLGDNGRWTSKNVSVDLTPFERTTNRVTSISALSTDGQYPSARAVYNAMGSYLPLAGGTMSNTNLVSNMNADLLDGNHYIAQVADWNSYSSSIFKSSEVNVPNAPLTGMYFYGIQLKFHRDTIYYTDIITDLYNDRLYYRRKTENGYHDWKKIAFTDSNVASATKLQTAVTLWGQSFNGSANVSGNISNSGHIRPSTSLSSDLGSPSLKWNNLYAQSGYIDKNILFGNSSDGLFVGCTAAGLGSGTGGLLYAYGSNPILFYAAGAERFSITSTRIDARTTVRASSNTSFVANGTSNYTVLRSDISDSRKWQIDTINDGVSWYVDAAREYVLNLASNGYVGVGTISPAYKLDVNGIIRAEKLIGTASGITETSLEDEEFTYQPVPVNDIADGYRLDKIKGKTLAWTQLVRNGNFAIASGWISSQFSVSISGGVLTASINSAQGEGSAVGGNTLGTVQGHQYYVRASVRYNTSLPGSDPWIGSGGYQGVTKAKSAFTVGSWGTINGIFTRATGGNDVIYFYPRPSGWSAGSSVSIKDFICVDLTLMFGAGNEPTAEEFEAMFPETYYDYTAGELINNSAEAIETEAADSSWTSRLALGLGSIKVKGSNGNILEFNGLASAGDVYDELEGGKLIKRIGSYTLTGSESWTANGSNMYRSNFTIPRKLSSTYWGTVGNLISSRLTAATNSAVYNGAVTSAVCFTDSTSAGYIGISKDVYDNIASYVGTTIYYELATPVTYDLVSPVPLSGRIDGNGTMRVISDGPVAPFRGDITYGCNPGQMGADASSVKSYLDTMLEIKVVNGVPMLHTTLPFYSDSFVSAGGLSGTSGSGSGSSLRDLSDVQLPEIITTGSALVYNGEKWVQSDAAFVPQTRMINGLELSSDISLSLGDLSNVNTAGASNGQSLVYYDGEWVPSGSGSGFLPLSGGSMTGTINMQTGSLTSTNTYKFTHTENGSEIFDAYFGANTNGLAAIYARNGIALRPANANNKGLVVTGTDMTYNGATILKAAVNTPGMVQVSVVSSGDLTTLLQIAESNTGISALDGKYRYYPVNISSDNKLYVHIPWYSGSGSGGSGSSVAYVPSLTSGTLIGTLKIDGSSYGLYAPAGGSGSASWGSTSKNTSPLTVGGTTKTVMLAGAATARDSSPTINTGGTTANRYYGVELSNDGKLFVNVPWIEGGGSTGSYLPLAGGTMTGTINSQSVIAKSNNAYDLGSSGKYYANTYTKKIYLDDGVYIYYDSTNRVIRVQGAGIAATGSVNAGGVSNT